LLLHHTNRASGRYRGSSQIGAGVDAILEMTVDQADPTTRIVKSRGRIRCETFRLRYSEASGYTLDAAGDLPVELQVYRAIEQNPGIGARRLRELVTGRNVDKDAALQDLLRRRAIEDRGSGQTRAYHVREEAGHGWARSGHGPGHTDFENPGARSGHGPGHTNSESRKSFGATAGHGVGTVPGTPVCPDPLEKGSRARARGQENWARSGAHHAEAAGPGLESLDPAYLAALVGENCTASRDDL
ncbi:MAG TPA: hypothetical protein VMG41_06445, partial [Gemmatimonadales bacterium]|nr:hypothetical protein [Gemmatimonadales bacterium]